MRKNIGIIIDDISNRAGTERAVINLSNILSELGHFHVIIVSLYTDNTCHSFYPLDKRVDILNLNLKKQNGFHNCAYLLFITSCKKIIQKYELHFIIGTSHALNTIITLFHRDVHVIGCEHFNFDSCTSKLSRMLRRLFYPRLDAVVLLTETDAKNYHFINNEKIFVIPNSLSFHCDMPSSLNEKRILFVGRLTKQKGCDYLIQIADLLKDKIPDWKINVFGDGEEREKLICEIEEHNLQEFLIIHGITDRVMEEMVKSSIYVMTSRFEGQGIVLIEAQECGLPIVCFNCKEGPSEILKHGKTGFLTEIGDIETFADYVIQLANDINMRKQFGYQAKKDAQKFSPQNIFLKWKQLFANIEGKSNDLL